MGTLPRAAVASPLSFPSCHRTVSARALVAVRLYLAAAVPAGQTTLRLLAIHEKNRPFPATVHVVASIRVGECTADGASRKRGQKTHPTLSAARALLPRPLSHAAAARHISDAGIHM